jgi:hypothetical protein
MNGFMKQLMKRKAVDAGFLTAPGAERLAGGKAYPAVQAVSGVHVVKNNNSVAITVKRILPCSRLAVNCLLFNCFPHSMHLFSKRLLVCLFRSNFARFQSPAFGDVAAKNKQLFSDYEFI